MASNTDPLDILVVGAGISGIAFASVYLGIHPDARLVIIEKDAVLGGTWSRRRLYDHFWTQWSVGFGEFADKPMQKPPDDKQFYGLFESKRTTEYLEDYTSSLVFSGRSLRDRIQFSSVVEHASKDGNLWRIQTVSEKTQERKTVTCRKLVIASGFTSIPNIPRLDGSSTFGGPIIHNVDFGASGILAEPNVKYITVLGGGKSGADMVYAAVKAGKSVAWIVRPSGTGPATFVTAKGKGPFKSAFELASTRAAEAVQPSWLAHQNWWTNFLHRSPYGQALFRKIWTTMDAEILADLGIDTRKTDRGYDKLAPHTSIFWRNNAAGMVNHPDFFDLVAEKVDIHYDEVDSLRPNTVSLKSGASFSTDCLLLGTGWQNSLQYLSPSLRADLGLPYPLSAELDDARQSQAKDWVQMEHKADTDVIKAFPYLGKPPTHTEESPRESPSRLYNLVVPVDDTDRSLACIGQIESTNYFRTGEAQALWITGYFDGRLDLPSVEQRKDEVAHFVAWNRRRYLNGGARGTSVVFDTLRYTDKLLDELGLKSHMKSGFSYIFSPNRAQDYAGIRDEYVERFGLKEAAKVATH